MAADLGPFKVVEAIRKMYPDGCLFFSRHGKRVEEPVLEPWRRGYKARINGSTHWFTSEGQFVAEGDKAIPLVRDRP